MLMSCEGLEVEQKYETHLMKFNVCVDVFGVEFSG